MKTLKVISTESKKDKRKKAYSLIELSQPDHVMQDNMRIEVEPKTQRITKYPESYLPEGDPQWGHDLKVGSNVAGDIVTRTGLLPYPITDPATGDITNHPTIASHVVFGNSDLDNFDDLVTKEFESRGKFVNDGSTRNSELFFKYWDANPVFMDGSEVVEATAGEPVLID